jgi:prophage antirepressor-like protein
MDKNNELAVFQGKNIRKTWNNNEWWFVIGDIVAALTDSKDAKGYLKGMRRRDEELSKGRVQTVHVLKVNTSGGKQSLKAKRGLGRKKLILNVCCLALNVE